MTLNAPGTAIMFLPRAALWASNMAIIISLLTHWHCALTQVCRAVVVKLELSSSFSEHLSVCVEGSSQIIALHFIDINTLDTHQLNTFR